MKRCNFCGDFFRSTKRVSNIFENLVCKKCLKTLKKDKKTLGIGVLHWKEDEAMLQKALSSIDRQKIDFSKIDVIVVTDGEGIKIDEEKIKLKNFKPRYFYREKNGRCGGTRNTIIEILDTQYIMFLDCDDTFNKRKSLRKVLRNIEKYSPDIYCSSIREELSNGKFQTYKNLMCLHMCHGKAYKKDFITRNNLSFIENKRIGEDTIFNGLCFDLCDSILYDTNNVSHNWMINYNSLTHTTKENPRLDSFFRCFDDVLADLNVWFARLSASDSSRFINKNFVTMMYNILYYRLITTKLPDNIKKSFLERYFDHIQINIVNMDLAKELGKNLNRKLMKRYERLDEYITRKSLSKQ